MRYFVLACDYDGTIATAGQVDPETIEVVAIEQEQFLSANDSRVRIRQAIEKRYTGSA